jgi:hypothetical protein
METDMADDFSPTVVQQTIPAADITPLELLLLSGIFSVEKDDGGYYFYTDQGPSDTVWATGAELRQAMTDRPDPESEAHRVVAELLKEPGDDNDEVEIDLVDVGWPALFQDIVQRSATLPYVSCLMAFTSSRLSQDSLGGQAILITANQVRSKSTFDLLDEFIRQAMADPASPDTEILVELRHTAVRDRIRHMQTSGLLRAGVPAEAVTDDDIRAAIRSAVGRPSFDSLQDFLVEQVASRAFQAAQARLDGEG